MGHTCDNVFRILIKMLDYDQNDIYIHVDKKSDITPFKEFLKQEVSHSKVYLLSL